MTTKRVLLFNVTLVVFSLCFLGLFGAAFAQHDSVVTTIFKEEGNPYTLQEKYYNSSKLLYKIIDFEMNQVNSTWYPDKIASLSYDADSNLIDSTVIYFNVYNGITLAPPHTTKLSLTYFPGHKRFTETFSINNNGGWVIDSYKQYSYTSNGSISSLLTNNYSGTNVSASSIDSIVYDAQQRIIFKMSLSFNFSNAVWEKESAQRQVYNSTLHEEADTVFYEGQFIDSTQNWEYRRIYVNVFNASNAKIQTKQIDRTVGGTWLYGDKTYYTYYSSGLLATVRDSVLDNGIYYIDVKTVYTYNSFNKVTSCIVDVYPPVHHVHQFFYYFDSHGFPTGSYTDSENNGGDHTLSTTEIYYYKVWGDSSICASTNAVLSVSGGNSYLWNTGDISSTISVNQSGIYSCSITLLNGWSFASTPFKVTASVSPPILPLASDSMHRVCNNGALILNSPQDSLLFYQWMVNDSILPGATSNNLFLFNGFWIPGKYNLIASNGCGADTSASTFVSSKLALQVGITALSATTFCNGDSVVLLADSGYVKYKWNNTYQYTNQTFIAKSTAINVVQAQDTNGCYTTASVSVNQKAGNQYKLEIVQINAQLRFNYSQNGVPITWYLNDTIIPGANQYNYFPTRTGYYKVATGGDSSCWKTSAPFYFEYNKLIANAGNDRNICIYSSFLVKLGANFNVAFGGYPPYTYSWSPSTNLNDSTLPNPTCFSRQNLWYYLTVTDSLGQTAVDSIHLSFYHIPAPEFLSSDTALCYGKFMTLNMNNSNHPRFYFTKNDTAFSTSTTQNVKITKSGRYRAFYINTDLCQSDTSSEYVFTVYPPMHDSSFAIAGNPVSCGGTGIKLVAKNELGRHYLWKRFYNGQYFSAGGDTAEIMPTIGGNYTLKVSDSNNCSYTTTKTVDPNSFNVYTQFVGGLEQCVEDSLRLSCVYDSSYTYQWYTTNNVLIPGATNHYLVMTNSIGGYYVHVSNTFGCSANSTAYNYQPPVPDYLLIERQNSILKVRYNNYYFPLTKDYFRIRWYKDGSLLPSADSASINTNWEHGIFKATVDQVNQEYCKVEKTMELNFYLSQYTNPELCDSICSGSYFVGPASSGYSPYSYYLNNSAISNYSETACAGNYTIKVINAGGDSAFVSFNIAPNLRFTQSLQHTSCSACADGSINVMLSGGTPPYNYSWTPAFGIQNGDTITNLPAGIYTVCVSDSLGCMLCFTDTILDNPLSVQSIKNSSAAFLVNYQMDFNSIAVKSSFVDEPANYLFTFTDMLGKKLSETPLKHSLTQIPITVSHGLYLYYITRNGIQIKSGKLIID